MNGCPWCPTVSSRKATIEMFSRSYNTFVIPKVNIGWVQWQQFMWPNIPATLPVELLRPAIRLGFTHTLPFTAAKRYPTHGQLLVEKLIPLELLVIPSHLDGGGTLWD